MNFPSVADAIRALGLEVRRVPNLYAFRRPLILILAGLAVVLLVLHRAGVLDRPSSLDPIRFEGTAAAVVGTVVDTPDFRPSGGVYTVAAETLSVPGEPSVSVDGSVLCEVLGSTAVLARPGDRVRFFGRIRTPEPSRIPGTFDYRAYLALRGTHALVYTGPGSFENFGPSGRYRLLSAAWDLQRRMITAFNRRLPPAEAAVLAGLTVGQRPRFFPDLRRAFIGSGTMHVLVASGSNVGFIVAGWLFLSALGGVPRRAALLTALPAVWAYVLVVGGDAPIARGGTMATVAIAAYIFAREDRPIHALAVAALARLLLQPTSLFDVSFQMSFLTVLGLMHHLPPLEPWVSTRPAWIRWPVRLLYGSFVAHLWLLPVSAAVFHRIQACGLLANLVIVPLAEFGLPVGLALAAIDTLSPGFFASTGARVAGHVASFYGELLIRAATWFAGLSHPLWLPMPTATGVIAFYAVCLMVPFMGRSWLARLGVTGGVAVLCLRAWAPPPFIVHGWGAVWVDVGPRCATILVDENHHAVVLNPGPAAPADSSERTLAPFLAVARIRSVDALVVTDPRLAAGDVDAFLRQRTVRRVIVATATVTEAGAGFSAGGFHFTPLPSAAVGGEIPFLIERDGRALVLSHHLELEAQGALLERHPDIGAIQARFAPDAVWSPEFLQSQSPTLQIETAGASRESVPAWRSRLVRPQADGWTWWDARIARDQRKS